MAQPATVVRFHACNPKQIVDRALHMQCARKYFRKTRISWFLTMFHLMLKYHDSFFEEEGSIDAKAAVAIAIVCTPKGEEPASSGAQHLGVRVPAHGPDFGALAGQV